MFARARAVVWTTVATPPPVAVSARSAFFLAATVATPPPVTVTDAWWTSPAEPRSRSRLIYSTVIAMSQPVFPAFEFVTWTQRMP